MAASDDDDLAPFLARRPHGGRGYRLAGYVGVAAVACYPDCGIVLTAVLIGGVLVWLAAWYQAVGALWRSALVAACLAAAVALTRIALTEGGWVC